MAELILKTENGGSVTLRPSTTGTNVVLDLPAQNSALLTQTNLDAQASGILSESQDYATQSQSALIAAEAARDAAYVNANVYDTTAASPACR